MTDLAALDVLAVDCQSTGATPAHGSLLELGWGRPGAPAESVLVTLPEGATIPRAVTRVTGIRSEDLEGAVSPAQAWDRLADALGATPTAVAHFARFEARFLEDLHASLGAGALPFRLVCTHEIARRLLPDLPRRGLRALAGYFGWPLAAPRRSAEHVEATLFVWQKLAERLAEEGVRDPEALARFLEARPPARPGARGWPMPKEALADLPKAPGVYRMRRVDGSLLYIGKAKCLRTRVRSYFQRRRSVPDRQLEMLSQARALDVERTETALEAALREHDLIKAEAPPYNVALTSGRVVWSSRDFRSLAEAPDDVHVVGPVIAPRALAGLGDLADWMRAGEAQDAETIARALAVSPAWGPEPEVAEAGLRVFTARHPDVAPTPRALLSFGRARWPLERRADDEADDDAEEDDAEAPAGWSAEGIADHLEERLARAAHARRRARWLTILAESAVSWRAGERRRCLVITGGDVAGRGWTAAGAPPPCPPGFTRDAAARRLAFDRDRRDRLRVLTTELRRLHAEGAAPEIRCGPSALVRGDALGRLLALI